MLGKGQFGVWTLVLCYMVMFQGKKKKKEVQFSFEEVDKFADHWDLPAE